MTRKATFIVLFLTTLLLVACTPPAAIPAVTPVVQQPAVIPAAKAELPVAVEYNLGETTIVQDRFPEESRFRTMPVRLNGMIAAPAEDVGFYPVVVILHGTHPGCPVIDHVDRWPCDPADERPNYRGFGYLAEHLAANGYVALSININAENTFGFGEPTPGERLTQIIDGHLRALAEASAGGENEFGLDLEGKADMHRLALLGHSRGGEMALELTRSPEMVAAAAAADDGYGPVTGVLQIAPSPVFADPADGSPIPLAIILPMCDGDVTNLEGQHFFEAARLAPGQEAMVASAFVERANHNFFNSTLGDDPFGRPGRPDCDPLLKPEAQQAFLGAYTVDFLATLFGSGADAQTARERMGMTPAMPAPSELYGLDARVAVLPEASERQAIFTPATADELATNRLGGRVLAEGLATFFCEAGYFTPATRPGSEPCRRANVVIPGNPALAVVSWETPGAALRFEIPPGKRDLAQVVAITMRAAVDPMSELNAEGEHQSLSIRLTDAGGRSAAASARPDEPALSYPQGEIVSDENFGARFTGRLPLTTIRFQMSAMQGVDMTDIRELALVFDQRPHGSLFLADVEMARAEE